MDEVGVGGVGEVDANLPDLQVVMGWRRFWMKWS
jgi:hypothetical protein